MESGFVLVIGQLQAHHPSEQDAVVKADRTTRTNPPLRLQLAEKVKRCLVLGPHLNGLKIVL